MQICNRTNYGLVALFAGIMLLFSPVSQADRVIELNSGEQQVTLLELFTSQGCSSCPAAERWLNEYTSKPELWKKVVPLAFHVDYWDYLGWPDVLASSDYSDRQREYRKQNRIRTVYTPGVVTNGREWRGWIYRFKPPATGKSSGTLTAIITQNKIKANFTDTGRPLNLNVAILGFGITTDIKRGENRNSRPTQEFVVIAHNTHPSHNGEWTAQIPVAEYITAQRYAIALWVATTNSLVPLQATGGWLPSDFTQKTR